MLPFLGLAFGLRFSLFERTCPLAIVCPFDCVRLILCRTSAEIRFEPRQQMRARGPRVGALFEPEAHIVVADRARPIAIVLREPLAAIGRVFGLFAPRRHEGFRIAGLRRVRLGRLLAHHRGVLGRCPSRSAPP